MRVSDLLVPLELQHLNGETSLSAQVSCAFTGDLLSNALAKGQKGMAFITVQTHLNVIAVASLHGFACVIVADGCRVEADVLRKATEEGIPVLSSHLCAYALSGKLYELGIR